jgi:hypothetical protein
MSYEFIYIIYQTTNTFLYSLCAYPFVKLYAEIGICYLVEKMVEQWNTKI